MLLDLSLPPLIVLSKCLTFALRHWAPQVEDQWKTTNFTVLSHGDSKDAFILGGTDDIQVGALGTRSLRPSFVLTHLLWLSNDWFLRRVCVCVCREGTPGWQHHQRGHGGIFSLRGANQAQSGQTAEAVDPLQPDTGKGQNTNTHTHTQTQITKICMLDTHF